MSGPAHAKRLPEGLVQVYFSGAVLQGYTRPPESPRECIFAQSTVCISADLKTIITPCQFGGKPVCSECGCIASAGLASIGRCRLGGLLPVAEVFRASQSIGHRLRPAV